MKEIKNDSGIICCKSINHTMADVGIIGTSKCNKPATHFNGSHYFCKRHSKTGRFVIRNGEVGEILARFNTEKELRANISDYPGMMMLKLTHSHRKIIY